MIWDQKLKISPENWGNSLKTLKIFADRGISDWSPFHLFLEYSYLLAMHINLNP